MADSRVVLLQLLSIHDGAVGVTNLDVLLLWFTLSSADQGPTARFRARAGI